MLGGSALSVYEVSVGVAKSDRADAERTKLARLLGEVQVLVLDVAAAREAAQVRADLERVGKSCGAYDLLIAGHALSLNPLATGNVREFSRVDGLHVENWLT